MAGGDGGSVGVGPGGRIGGKREVVVKRLKVILKEHKGVVQMITISVCVFHMVRSGISGNYVYIIMQL